MVRTSMTRLAEHLDDHQFQISALMKRVKELETAGTTQATDLSDDNYTGRANVRWLSDRIKKLENENTALSGTIHKERISQLEMNADIMRRLRALERECSVIGDVPTSPGQSPASARKYRKYQVRKGLDEVMKVMKQLNELVGPLED